MNRAKEAVAGRFDSVQAHLNGAAVSTAGPKHPGELPADGLWLLQAPATAGAKAPFQPLPEAAVQAKQCGATLIVRCIRTP